MNSKSASASINSVTNRSSSFWILVVRGAANEGNIWWVIPRTWALQFKFLVSIITNVRVTEYWLYLGGDREPPEVKQLFHPLQAWGHTANPTPSVSRIPSEICNHPVEMVDDCLRHWKRNRVSKTGDYPDVTLSWEILRDNNNTNKVSRLSKSYSQTSVGQNEQGWHHLQPEAWCDFYDRSRWNPRCRKVFGDKNICKFGIISTWLWDSHFWGYNSTTDSEVGVSGFLNFDQCIWFCLSHRLKIYFIDKGFSV